MSLTTYRQKRHFDSTPEPRGRQSSSSKGLRFVVQKHEASRLHYDFRLEVAGTLKSWAVPKGPSTHPGDKRLAIMVEDHPLDYRTFEGTIPAGNYGAGTVMVWDEGTYHARDAADRDNSEKLIVEGLNRGEIKFVLEGKKLRGEFALIKLRKGEQNAWLLLKKHDEHADAEDFNDDASAVSGRSMEEIASGAKPRRTKKRADTKPAAAAKKQPSRAAAAKKQPSKRGKFVSPMLATLVDEPFDRDGWIFEVKWDGYRAIAEIDKQNVELYSRNQLSFNDAYVDIVESLRKLGRKAILDGEVVVLDQEGKAQFQLLQNYRRNGKGQLIYYVFDLLSLDGKDLRSLPLRKRKTMLEEVVKGLSHVRYCEQVEKTGKSFFEAARVQGLEGIIAKNGVSHYTEGARGSDWLKIKTHLRQEAVIGGFTQPRGSRKDLGALVLGVYDSDGLRYIGHTGGGFDTKGLTAMRQQLDPLRQEECPFTKRPKTNAQVQWLDPALVCEVEFGGWTDDGRMRHPIFVGLREDKEPRSVHREVEKSVQKIVPTRNGIRTPAKSKKTTPADVEAQSPRSKLKKIAPADAASDQSPPLTNQTKSYWPDEGYTKGDLIAYYRSVASVILPYLKDRPQSLHRHPNGITGQSFFQKDVGKHPPPEWVKTVSIPLEGEKRRIETILCQDEKTLLYLANLGCIELNPWSSRVESLDRPDFLVIDLDPEEIAFAKVVEAAVAVHKALQKAGAASYCKTSGKTGLHVFVPLDARYEWEHARQFAEIIANIVHKKLPDSTSVVRSPSQRQGKVYLDYLQNSRGQTLAAPYSARPFPGATVSTPLKWSEVGKRLDPSRFTIKTMAKRLDAVGDIWQPVLEEGINLPECLERLSSRR